MPAPLVQEGLPNLIDRTGSRVYVYERNADGSTHVEAIYAGLGDGIGALGKRFHTLALAADAVRVAREIVINNGARARRPRTYQKVD
jgi:hypothetical protein